jgi:hypothetical protein
MEVVLRSELERLRKLGEVRCSDGVASQLKTISARTIDRPSQRYQILYIVLLPRS